jgi:hypothetical protein
MGENGWLEVKNWKQFQHYRDRDPTWIKLYRKVLADYEFSRLQDASKLLLICIWLLASEDAEHKGRVPNDPEWIARRSGLSGPVDMQPLIDAGFLLLARRKQDASRSVAKRLPRDRDRDREELRNKPTWLTPFADAWRANRGEPPFGRMAKSLRPVVAAHGLRQALMVWEGYLDDRRDKGFCTPEDFAGSYEIYRRKWAVEIGEDGTETPVPDSPEAAA